MRVRCELRCGCGCKAECEIGCGFTGERSDVRSAERSIDPTAAHLCYCKEDDEDEHQPHQRVLGRKRGSGELDGDGDVLLGEGGEGGGVRWG